MASSQEIWVFLCLHIAGRSKIDRKSNLTNPCCFIYTSEWFQRKPRDKPSSEFDFSEVSQPCLLELGCILQAFSQYFFFSSWGVGRGDGLWPACLQRTDYVPFCKILVQELLLCFFSIISHLNVLEKKKPKCLRSYCHLEANKLYYTVLSQPLRTLYCHS